MRIEEKMNILKLLEENNLLEYGRIIPRSVFEELFQATYDKGWEFLGPFLSFKEYLEENGYLCSGESLEPGALRILDLNEMSIKSDRILKSVNRRIQKLQDCFAKAKIDVTNESELRKHLFQTSKITASLYSLQSSLNSV